MAKHLFMFLTDAVAGKDAEYNAWYDNEHLSDVIRAAGFTAATRYKLADTEPPQQSDQKYLAVYEIDTDDPDGVFGKLTGAAGSPEMPLSDALDLSNMKTLIWEQTIEVTA